MNVRINLLPHREARRELRKRVFWFLTGLSAAAGVALVFLVWSVLQGIIGGQQERNDLLVAENRKLDAQIKEIDNLRNEIEALRARQRAVEDLQADRNQPVHLLDELARQTPEGVYLRAIKQEGPKVNVSGFAASNERVSEYLRNLQNNSRFLDRPDLIEIKLAGGNPPQQAVSSRRLFEFSLSFFMKPTAERVQLAGDRAGAAAGAPGAKTAAAAKR